MEAPWNYGLKIAAVYAAGYGVSRNVKKEAGVRIEGSFVSGHAFRHVAAAEIVRL
jgi:hypothetical protein